MTEEGEVELARPDQCEGCSPARSGSADAQFCLVVALGIDFYFRTTVRWCLVFNPPSVFEINFILLSDTKTVMNYRHGVINLLSKCITYFISATDSTLYVFLNTDS